MAEDDDDSMLTEGEFHQFAHKQIMNVVYSAVSEAKLEWAQVEPFLNAARSVCVGDVRENARVRLHTMRGEGEGWVEAEEAYFGITVSDRENGEEWLSETWWLSDIATADADRTEVIAIIAALERTIAKLNGWLANPGEKGGEAEAPSSEETGPGEATDSPAHPE